MLFYGSTPLGTCYLLINTISLKCYKVFELFIPFNVILLRENMLIRYKELIYVLKGKIRLMKSRLFVKKVIILIFFHKSKVDYL